MAHNHEHHSHGHHGHTHAPSNYGRAFAIGTVREATPDSKCKHYRAGFQASRMNLPTMPVLAFLDQHHLARCSLLTCIPASTIPAGSFLSRSSSGTMKRSVQSTYRLPISLAVEVPDIASQFLALLLTYLSLSPKPDSSRPFAVGHMSILSQIQNKINGLLHRVLGVEQVPLPNSRMYSDENSSRP